MFTEMEIYKVEFMYICLWFSCLISGDGRQVSQCTIVGWCPISKLVWRFVVPLAVEVSNEEQCSEWEPLVWIIMMQNFFMSQMKIIMLTEYLITVYKL